MPQASIIPFTANGDEDMLRNLADALPQIVWMTRPDGYVEYFNKQWYDYTGSTPAKSLGLEAWGAVLHPDDLESTREHWFNAIKTGGEYGIQYRLRRHDGEYRWFLARGLPVRDASGAISKWFGTCTDIHDQMLAEQQVREQSEFARSIVDSSNDCIKVVDAEGRLLQMNDNGLKVMGIDNFCSIEQKPWVDFWQGEYKERARAALARAMNGEPTRFEGQCHTATGIAKWWDVVLSPIRNAANEVDRVLIVSRDATEQRTHDAEFRQMADAMPQMVWMADPDGTHTYYNKRWYDYTGLSPEDSLGPRWTVMHPDHDVPCWEAWQHSLETGDTYQFEYQLRRYDGEYRWFLGRGIPVRDTSGNIIKWFGTCTDIHDNMTIANDLRDAIEFNRSVLESSTDGIKVLDTQGRILSMNPAGREHLEVEDPSSYLLKPWLDFWKDEAHTKAADALEAALKGRTTQFDGFRTTLRGRPKWWEVIVTPIRNTSGTVQQILAVSRDITERVTAAHELQQALEQAAAASLSKSEFLANMSHEIRTPMNAVVGLTNILSLSQPLTEKQKEFISTLKVSADQMLQLINDLLDTARIESDQMHLEAIPFDLNDVVRDTISINNVRAREKRITLESRGRCPTRLVGDPLRMKQVLMNLVSNAVKFTSEGAVSVNLFCNAHPGKALMDVIIAVEDSGIGIAPDKLEAIFGKFTQEDMSTARRFGGSGLGLSIAKTLVELMGGRITVNSQPGKGSCFTMTLSLPAVEGGIAAPEPAVVEAAPGPRTAARSPFKVLLVEDYHANVLVATLLLESFGYPYEVASSGEEALKKLEKETFGLVLMDVQMPQMSGYQATAVIREREAARGGKRLPIVGMTAHALRGDRERCIEAGMDDYISKPFRPENLQEIIGKYAENQAN